MQGLTCSKTTTLWNLDGRIGTGIFIYGARDLIIDGLTMNRAGFAAQGNIDEHGIPQPIHARNVSLVNMPPQPWKGVGVNPTPFPSTLPPTQNPPTPTQNPPTQNPPTPTQNPPTQNPPTQNPPTPPPPPTPPRLTVLFVSTKGSDTNTGAKDQPLATIQEAISRADVGDTVIVRPVSIERFC